MTASAHPPAAHCDTLTTPDGAFSVIATSSAVLASGWTDDVEALRALIHPDLQPDELIAVTDRSADDELTALVQARAAVHAYYDADFAAVAQVPVVQKSGPYRQSAWEALRSVAPGAPQSYTELAAHSGRPAAVRAAAAACAFNAAALFVPCHRVLRSDGSLGGFRYGVDLKQRLLDREAASAS